MVSSDRYERYEEKRRQAEPPSFLRRAATFLGKAAIAGAGLGVVAGVGYGAYRAIGADKVSGGLSKAMNAVTRGTEYLSGLGQGFSTTIRSAGLGNVLTGRATDELASNLGQSLRPWAAGKYNEQLGGGSVFRSERILNALKHRLKEAPEHAADTVRANVIREQIKKTEGLTEKMSEDLEKYLDPRSSAFRMRWSEATPLVYGKDNIKSLDELLFDKIKGASREYTGSEKDIMDAAILNLRKGLSSTAEKQDFIAEHATAIAEKAQAARDAFIDTAIEAANKTYGGRDPLRAKRDDPLLRKATFGDIKDSDLLKRRMMDKGSGQAFYQGLLEEIPELKGRIDDMPLDPSLFLTRSGDFVDTRGITRTADRLVDFMSREFQIPFVGIRPFGVIRPFVPSDKNEYMQYVFEAGQRTNIGKAFAATEERTIYFGGKLFDTSGNVLEENLFLTRFGAHKRALLSMDEASRHEELFKQLKDDKGFVSSVRKIYDIGMQENRGALGDFQSFFTKFSDTLWGPNIVKGVQSGAQYFRVDSYLDAVRSKTSRIADLASRQMTREELAAGKDAIVKAFGENFYDIITTGSTNDSVVNGMKFIVNDKKISELIGEEKTKSFRSIINRLESDADLFSKIKSAKSDDVESILDNVFDSLNIGGSEAITYGQSFAKDLHATILKTVMPKEGAGFANIDEAMRATFSDLSESSYKNLQNLELFGRFSGYKRMDKEALGSMRDLIGGLGASREWDQPLTERVQTLYKKADRAWGFGAKPKPATIIGPETPVIVRQSKIANTFLEGINSRIADGTFEISDMMGVLGDTGRQILKEAGFGKDRAGRRNLDQATTFTTSIYNVFARLNDGLSSASIGLSKRHTGSTQDLATNLFLKRVLLPVATMGYIKYLNDQIGNFVGQEPSDVVVKGFASATLGVQKAKDLLGLNAIGRWTDRVFPGSDLLWKSPILSPVRMGTLGLLGDHRGYDELYHYITEGDEPIRKGRWWSFGSQTPWYGGRVTAHHPSYYRRIIGEPEMTESLWGSEREYWANNWLPTPHNPLGPLKTWVFDPYHWERKHEKDRPAAVYGGIPELESIPMVGPMVDATVGRVFKPIRRNPKLRKAHREYIRQINEHIRSSYSDQEQGGMLYITPGGRITPKISDSSMGFGTPGYGSQDLAYGMAPGVGPGGPQMGPGGFPVLPGDNVPSTGRGSYMGAGAGAAASRQQLTDINEQLKALPDLDMKSIRNLEDSRLSDSLGDFADPNSAIYRLNESSYFARQVMGLRGFATELVFGDIGKPRMILESSSRGYGYERQFWDEELGGRTGDLSEIVRRFIPHRRKDIREYNPIRNQMPDWLPSNKDYFQDFIHGDPFIKVTQGEARLPGDAYESINQLHPDRYFGRYGALDRMKILGDVAPWSEQYKYYSKIVSAMHTAGEYTDEEYKIAIRVRQQVAQRKRKYDFFNYKFKESRILEKTVTVSRVIDPYTFTTEEFGSVPIRLAGVKGPKTTKTAEGEKIAAVSASMIQPGEKVRIGYSDDPLARIKGDTMDTIRAVVWSGGKKVQSALAQTGLVETDYEATDPATVHALYGGFERAAGKLWETVTHFDNPISTKFLQTRTPLEMYKRNWVYGKEFRSWDHPIKSWIKPSIDKRAAMNPLWATLTGAAVGTFFFRSTGSKAVGAAIGGGVSFAASGIRTMKEFVGRFGDREYTWIPKEKRQVREIEEYFDRLKYVKYKGLYEKAKRAAREYEGIDLDEVIDVIEGESRATTFEARKLKKVKSLIKSTMGDDLVDQQEAQARLDDINARLAEIGGTKRGMLLGPIAMEALSYKQEYEATLYGADPHGDISTIYQALPKVDRPFFKEFLTAKPSEREEILRLVPKNQRPFYQAKWGLKIDKKQSLTEYFATHYLPGADWEGWMPEQSLEETKLKFVHQQRHDLGEYGFWESDLSEIGPGTPAVSRTSSPIFGLDLIKLKSVLEGRGLSDVDIYISREQTEDPNTSFEMNLDIRHNRRKEVKQLFNRNVSSILG